MLFKNKKVLGNLNITVYKDHDKYSFDIDSSNDIVLPISYVLEDTLKRY